MCDVLVLSDQTFLDKEKKKKFQDEQKTEIKKLHRSPIILFIYGDTKNSKKTEERFVKDHPRGMIWDPKTKSFLWGGL